jgi:ribosomal protein S27E
MTIQFNCPYCDALIAFPDRHAGKHARCLTCGQLFIIPSSDGEKPQKIEPKIQKAEPVPGFYRAAQHHWALSSQRYALSSFWAQEYAA